VKWQGAGYSHGLSSLLHDFPCLTVGIGWSSGLFSLDAYMVFASSCVVMGGQ
jgi:hypothetical protein